MPGPELNDTPQDASRHREAIADMQERLAQFGRLVGQVREGLPEHQAQALGRIELGIESLAERIAAFGHDGQRRERADTPAASPTPADADDPWNAQSAEALMQAYETAEAESRSAGQEARAYRYRQGPREAALAKPHALPAQDPASDAGQDRTQDRAWLDARFADIAALLQRGLADTNPASSLAALDRRLDQFERRLDIALSDMAQGADRQGLKLIDAHVTELAGHVEAIRQQLDRLDAMDSQLCELTRTLEGHQQPRADFAAPSEDVLAALIEAAAERAASRITVSMPAEAVSQERIDVLEGLLQEYIAERRRGDEVSGSILHTIEDALVRIVDRVEAMEGVKSTATAPPYGDAPERDGMDVEHDRLAEAYAEGARVLGQQEPSLLAPTLHAANYAPAAQRPDRREEPETSPEPLSPQASADEPAPQEEQTRQELRASALRAKLKAQGVPQEPDESAGPEAAKAGLLGHGRIRTWTSTRAGSHRSSLLLGAAMALLFGTGFAAVDSLLGSAPPAAAQRRALEPQPASETGKGDLTQPAADRKVQPAPIPQPVPSRSAPEAATDDQSQDQPAPTRRLNRLQSGTAAAPIGTTPIVLSSPQDGAGATGNVGTRAVGAGSEIPPAVGTERLREAAATGDAFAQFEIATRFAEGKGVAQDHSRAFAWYERAATRGLASAQFRLAAYFERGVGVAPDKERAKVWYTRAAEQGYIRAMHNLGVLTVGTGERQTDYSAAARWFEQAAERGLSDSQFNLAVLHENGRGVPKDLQEAYKWFTLAARSGDPVAARRLEQIKARMEPAEIEAAERKLATWRPSATEQITGSIGTGASPARRK